MLSARNWNRVRLGWWGGIFTWSGGNWGDLREQEGPDGWTW